MVTLITLCTAVGQLQPGECLEISNAQVDMFRSSMRLTAGPNGTVTKTEALGVDVNVSAYTWCLYSTAMIEAHAVL